MTNPYKFILGNPRYVALGDSYSSGTGAFNYDVMGVPCYRSTDSYAYYISSELSLDRPDLGACHGAVTHDVLNVSGAAIAQVDRLSADTELVTLTIGGNDVGFQSVLNDCVARNHQGYGCASNPNVTLPLSERMLALAGEWNAGSPLMVPGTNTPIHSIADVLEAITIKAPNAEVYIAGYPRLFGEDSAFYTANFFAPGGYYCTVNTAVLAAATAQVSLGDASWLNSQADTLNAIIENAVEDARMLGKSVHFVSPHNFDTHGLCDSGSAWLNDVEIGGSGEVMPESFHPTTVGMALGYGDAFIDRMN